MFRLGYFKNQFDLAFCYKKIQTRIRFKKRKEILEIGLVVRANLPENVQHRLKHLQNLH